MDEADGDDAIDMTPQIAVAPEFSLHQIASFKEMEKEFSRERNSQYIVSAHISYIISIFIFFAIGSKN